MGCLCLELEGLLQWGKLQRDAGVEVMYGEYKRRGNESYLQRRELFLAHNSFKDWIVDDPQVSELFPLT